MPTPQSTSGFVNIGKAKIYYEMAGEGMPLVMIHAGVADSRQWNNEFADAEKAFEAGNLDLVAEIETQIWFDGMGRTAA